MLPREENLLHLRDVHRFLLISQVPDRHSILHGLIDAKEEIDDALAVRITKVVRQVALNARDQLRCNRKDALLLAKLGVMRN